MEIHCGHFVTQSVRLPRANRRRGQSPTAEVLWIEEKGSDVNPATWTQSLRQLPTETWLPTVLHDSKGPIRRRKDW